MKVGIQPRGASIGFVQICQYFRSYQTSKYFPFFRLSLSLFYLFQTPPNSPIFIIFDQVDIEAPPKPAPFSISVKTGCRYNEYLIIIGSAKTKMTLWVFDCVQL